MRNERNAECGFRNAEYQRRGSCRERPALTIPHSALRIPHLSVPHSALGFHHAPPLPPHPLLPAPLLLLRFLDRRTQAHPDAVVRGRRAQGTRRLARELARVG